MWLELVNFFQTWLEMVGAWWADILAQFLGG
jgi:hypothetical protein